MMLVTCCASSMGLAWSAAPLCAIAPTSSLETPGVPSSVPTLIPPADSPKIVIRRGSPPNAAMLSFTHWMAAIWSQMPLLPEPSNGEPSTPSR